LNEGFALMDERVLERMIARSVRTIKSPPALMLCGSIMFVSTLFWIVLHLLLGRIGGVFHMPIVFVISSFAVLPIALIIPPLAAWCLSVRSGYEALPLNEVMQQRWKHSVALFLYALGFSVGEVLLGVIVALWCGIEAIPLFGSAVYIFFSWVPTLVIILMGVLLCLHILLLFVVGTILAQTPILEQKGLVSDILAYVRKDWFLRLKFLSAGFFPSVIYYSAITIWTMKGLPQGIEFCASIFRGIAFSAIEAPLFLFLIHMAVEADRYIQWLSSRRVG
jgi:hypothetical protein